MVRDFKGQGTMTLRLASAIPNEFMNIFIRTEGKYTSNAELTLDAQSIASLRDYLNSIEGLPKPAPTWKDMPVTSTEQLLDIANNAYDAESEDFLVLAQELHDYLHEG